MGTVAAIVAFATSWVAITRDSHIKIPRVGVVALIFVGAISVRMLLPPYGTDRIAPDVTRTLLIVGVFGLVFFVYERMDFQRSLLVIVAMGLACAFISMLVYFAQENFGDARLAFFGRSSHPIMGAGAIALATLAALSVASYPTGASRSHVVTAGLGVAIVVFVASLVLTGSRGPAIALVFAIATTPIVMVSRSPLIPVIFGFGAWAVVTSSVLLEPYIHGAVCQTIPSACRESARQEIWHLAGQMVAQNPMWGSGYAFRFPVWPHHAHNAYFGMALNYGVPLVLLFIGLMATALWRTAQMKHRAQRFFVVSSLIFANGFMGSDLNDPMRFLGTHHLFLWFPLCLALVSEKGASDGRTFQPVAAT